ncbi:serine/threonine-protein kinase AFC3 isoform X1 [Primulina huaijiensis]|uniref:serine/threonine-protein kinase AFC3 isoform X1 n=2 Tax=Primulina huaijiensis TaxID=1492673 RepID=UPI003CC75780
MAEEREARYKKRRRLAGGIAPSRLHEHENGRWDGQDYAAKLRVTPFLRRHVTPRKREDDRDGHYVFILGENLTSRYKILGKMGEGTFGRVLECWDREIREYVAIKVVKSTAKYRDAARVEIDVLQRLTENDKGDSHCVRMLDWFDHRNHMCIVFEKLGPSLFDFLKRNKYSPFPVDLVREFGRQLLESVSYMHDLWLIHTDLKPENILLVSSEFVILPVSKKISDETNFRCVPKSSAIKLIDFGSTAYDNRIHSSIVSTRHYRAPEVILGLGWTYPCDMWSVGCILVELCSGETLFQTHDNLEHLAMMERVLGTLPEHMILRARNTENLFKRTRLNWPEGAVSRESIRAVKKLDHLKNLVSRHVDSTRSSLVNLLHGLLKFDPSERLTARQALDHPFFRDATSQ